MKLIRTAPSAVDGLFQRFHSGRYRRRLRNRRTPAPSPLGTHPKKAA